ncbi:glycosyl hydrolase [Roseivirga sp. BDSF3-8]|uniref:glycosyl hydrolase n=1 Tax=Roseivirga sp. BDSF3-8 TaxID=3241598 RepID=UPI0035324D1B
MLKQVTTFIIFLSILFIGRLSHAQIVSVGSGSYTKTFPGTDEAGRNGFPPGTPQASGNAAAQPVPTNDWWSKLLQEDHASNLFNYPITMKTTPAGLVTTFIPWGVIDDQEPIVVGVSGLNASRATISDHTDWTVTMDWDSRFHATSGIGMPFVYFEKQAAEVASVTVNLGTVTVTGRMLLVTDARNGADFAIYAPAGSTWTQQGNTYTSDLNGQNYWSLAMLPQDNTNPAEVADAYARYAYVFPADTKATYTYHEANATVRTEFTVTTDIKEGANTNMLIGLLPHQWAHLAADSPQPQEHSYTSVRGELKMLQGNSFSVEHRFYGILPTLPYLANYSEGFDLSALSEKVSLMENESLATWTDSYNEGQMMNRLIQTARIADKMGDTEARDKMIATIQERLEDWLTAEAGEVAFLFYYNTDWTALLGYPSGHGQDTNLNDHHFHWGYFIHAAAFLEQYRPGWAAGWGEMVNLLVRDAAGDRDDALFPFLRNFSPYAGHSWANGFASFPQGNDQESTSESMQFCSSLIHWGAVTGNDQIRDLGIYLYTTEQTAIEEYWFDVNNRNFQPGQQYALVSRVWGNSYDNGTFWTNDIEASYGIELYPIHGGSMYLGHNIAYAKKLWAEIEQNTGILNQDDNVNLWHDTMWKFLAFTDPQKAIDLYDQYPGRTLKFGTSDAQTYYWLHAMNAMGQVVTRITSNHPLAVVFDKDGQLTYTAHNYSDAPITVSFSDGYTLQVPANSMATSRDADIKGTLTTSFQTAYPGGSVALTVTITSGTATKVEFFKNGKLIGEDDTAPYTTTVSNLAAGKHGFYAKIYQGDAFNTTNIVEVISGSQAPYQGTAATLPGTIQAGHYDEFAGGSGQNISYYDASPGNNGDFRTGQDVDAASVTNEGATVGWISAGEWLEYTVDVDASAYYSLSFRFASGNPSGGGPFYLEMDGERITHDIFLTYTGDWGNWQTKTVDDIPLHEGQHVLRLVCYQGEFNVGKMTFAYQSDLPYTPPIANAGDNVVVTIPATTAVLDGSGSRGGVSDLTYAWRQLNGPSIAVITNTESISPDLSGLQEGIYTFELTVLDGTYSDTDQVLVIVSETGNSAPAVSITSPADEATFEQGTDITITANATDIDGSIALVAFYDGDTKIGQDDTAPFSYTYTNASAGPHSLTALATDDKNATSTSEAVMVTVVEVKECEQTLSEATEGTFSTGYTATFRTIGTSVTITFRLLDTDKSGVVAYLFRESPFAETPMQPVGNNTFTATVNGLQHGATISYAAKFAFAGGLAVTKYIRYEVGTTCGPEDTTPPANVSVTAGDITDTSIALKLNATDEAGTINYVISYDSGTMNITGDSGTEQTVEVEDLMPGTSYTFTVSASDPDGNTADDEVLTVTTAAEVISGIDDEVLEGLRVYPNPSPSYVTIDIPPGSSLTFHSLVNAIGATQSVPLTRTVKGYQLDLTPLTAGIYFVNLTTADGQVLRGIRVFRE